MALEVPAHVRAYVDGDVFVIRDERATIDHDLGSTTRVVFEFIQQDATRPEVISALSGDPFVGPLRASDVYDTVTADLQQRGLVVPATSTTSALASLAAHATRRVYPWYDSPWLAKWTGARDLAQRENPALAAELIAMAEPLRTDPAFETQPLGAIADDALLARMRSAIERLDPSAVEMHEGDAFGRTLVHNHPVFNEIQRSFLDLASEAAGEELEVSYNFLSLYTNLGVCAPHLDSPKAKYTLDLCIDQSDPWPIHISQVVPWPEDYVVSDNWAQEIRECPDLHFRSYTLEPGQAIFFSGPSQWHYHDRHPENEHGYYNLIFFHFIPKGTRDFVELFEH